MPSASRNDPERLLSTALSAALTRAAVDGLFDGAVWRALERAARLSRQVRRGAAVPRAPVRQGPGDALESVVRALEVALATGAADTAAELAERALERVPTTATADRARAVAAVIELRMTVGDRAGAEALARDHRDALERSARGATVLDALGMRAEPPRRLPNGRPNAIALAREIGTGRISAAELDGLLLRSPGALLRDPQLHLLPWNAEVGHDLERASRAISRFFRAHGLTGGRVLGGGANVLERIELDRPSGSSEGPLVSIVVSAFDAEQTLGYAVSSLLAQTYRSLEILVCDDGSRDGTRALMQSRFGSDPRVRLFYSRANQGTYNVRNALLEVARGELLTVHDADDLAHPSRITRQVEAIRRHRAGASVASWIRMRPSGEVVFFRDQSAVRLAIVSLMFTRDVWRRHGPYRSARFGADLELYEDLRAAGAIVRERAPLLIGLWSESSMTRSAGAQALEDGFRSPARRAYSQMIALKREGTLGDRAIEMRLRELGNLAAAAGVVELPRSTGR